MVDGLLSTMECMKRFFNRDRGQRPFPKTVDASQLIISLPAMASVVQQQTTHLFNWPTAVDRAQIFAGPAPDAVDTTLPLVTVARQQAAVVHGLDADRRHYFELWLQQRGRDVQRLPLAVRVLPFQEVTNFRDIGGYRTEDGRFVRWGRVYRAGTLSEMTRWDQTYFQSLGVHSIVDLRSPSEFERRPHRLPNGGAWQLVQRPIQSVDRVSRLQSVWAALFRRHKLSDMMRHGYMHIIVEEHAHIIGELFQMMADAARLPLVVHCTAGKDRTGLVMALLLHVLGVPDDTILADYTLSNQFYDRFRQSVLPDVKPLLRFGVSIDELWPLLVVEESTLQDTFSLLRTRYGSIRAYLAQRAGVSEALIAQLHHNLLRPPM